MCKTLSHFILIFLLLFLPCRLHVIVTLRHCFFGFRGWSGEDMHDVVDPVGQWPFLDQLSVLHRPECLFVVLYDRVFLFDHTDETLFLTTQNVQQFVLLLLDTLESLYRLLSALLDALHLFNYATCQLLRGLDGQWVDRVPSVLTRENVCHHHDAL